MRALLFSDPQFDLNSFHKLSEGLGIGHTPFGEVRSETAAACALKLMLALTQK